MLRLSKMQYKHRGPPTHGTSPAPSPHEQTVLVFGHRVISS